MSRLLKTTPKADGFFAPGEFMPHNRAWFLWPERPDTWRNGAKPAQQAFVKVAAAIAEDEPVTVGVSPRQFVNARHMLPEHIRVVEISNNDSWFHDTGPNFVINGAGDVRGVDWRFNAYGGLEEGLYFPWDQDDLIPQKVLEIEELDRYRAPFTTEGGALQCDGEGTLIVTEQALLNPNRNPQYSKEEATQILEDYLGVEKVIWLPFGCKFDETDGHIDDLCCFMRPAELAMSWTDDPDDPQYEIFTDAYERLNNETDAKGRKFKIHKIHQPSALEATEEEAAGLDCNPAAWERSEGNRICGSYINYYTGNHSIVVPEFGDPMDKPAQEILAACFPNKKIVGVPGCREILLGGGNIKCITAPQPNGYSE